MTRFAPIRDLLDRASERGDTIEFWWRDDDATRHTPALDRLLQLSRSSGLPVAIAAIPIGTEPSLVERLRDEPGIRVVVHGLAHANHALPDSKRAEFAARRPLPDMEGDARLGLETIRSSFRSQALSVLAPPWNRIDPRLELRLPALGYEGLSTFGPRGRTAAEGVRVVNTHLDPVDWRGTRGAVEVGRLAEALRGVIEAAPQGHPVEPIGLLTHHLDFDEELWSLTAALVETLLAHPAVRVRPLDALWPAKKRH